MEVSGPCVRSKEQGNHRDTSSLRKTRPNEPSRCQIFHAVKDRNNLHGTCIDDATIMVASRTKTYIQMATLLVHFSDG